MATDDQNRGPDADLIELGPWTGVNEVDDERSLAPDEVREAVNFDFLNRGVRRTRPGQTERLTLNDAHSLWSDGDTAYLMEAGDLCELDYHEWSLSALQSGLNPDALVTYTKAGGAVYWSNGEVSGRIVGGVAGVWGLPVPGQLTVAATTGGNMREGRYMVAAVFVSSTGEESGATISRIVEVTANGGIQLTGIPQTTEATHVRIFQTKPYGDIFYRRIDIPMGQTSYALGAGRLLSTMDTQFADRVPAGHIVRYFNGQIFIASGSNVAYTLPHRYGLYVPDRDVLPFNSRVTVMEPAGESGMFVVADKTYYLQQGEAVVNRRVVSPYGAVEGTGLQVPAAVLGLEEVYGEVPVWTPKGATAILAAGLPGGAIRYYGRNKVALADYETGSALLRKQNGIAAIVTALRDKGLSDAMGASDTVDIKIIREGLRYEPWADNQWHASSVAI